MRAATSCGSDCASPHASEPSVNTPSATSSTSRRPRRSPSRPYTGTIVADARRYPTAIHDVSRSPPSDSAIAGVAVASSVWSTAAMNIGRNTEPKRFMNSARETVVSAGRPAPTVSFLMGRIILARNPNGAISMPSADNRPRVQHLEGTDFQKSRGFSPAVISEGGRIVWLAGQTTTTDLEGREIAGKFDEQARTLFALLNRTLERAGGSLANLVTMTVFIDDARNGDRHDPIQREDLPDGLHSCG